MERLAFDNLERHDQNQDPYKQIFQFSATPAIIHDLDMNILSMNEQAIQEFGYTKEEVSQMKVHDLHADNGLEDSLDSLDHLSGNHHFTMKRVFSRKDGSLFQTNVTSSTYLLENKPFFHVSIEIINNELYQQNESHSLASIIQNSLNEIYIFDSERLKFQFLNRGALQNLEYSLEEALCLSPIDLKPEFNEENFRALIKPILSGEQEKIVFHTYHLRKNKSRYPVEVHLQGTIYKGQYALTAIILDISIRKDYEKKLEELSTETRKTNLKLKHFAATSAHDLQEPLRMISSFSGLLSTKYAKNLDEKGQKYLFFLTDGAERLKLLVQNILEYTEIEFSNFKKEKIDVNYVLDQVMTDLAISIGERNAEILLPKKQVFVESQSVLLYRVFLNLFSNSIKYTAQNIKPVLNLEVTNLDGLLKFSLTDNGIGIEKENQKKIFLPLIRLHSKSEYNGTGIGLSIVQSIIHLHGGEIWVESELSKGATFHFTLPVSNDN